MPVVGTHRDGDFTAMLQFEESLHHVVHVDVAFQVVGFVEVAFRIALRAAQVHKVDTVMTAPSGRRSRGAAYAQRTRAQAQAVALVGGGINRNLEVGSAAHDRGSPRGEPGRVVRMDNQLDTGLVGDGANFTEEVNRVGAQLFGCDRLRRFEALSGTAQGEALFPGGQAGNHVAYKQLLVIFRHPIEAGFGLGLFLVRIIGFRAGTLQQERRSKAMRPRSKHRARLPSGQLVGKVGACPVQHGHEVVGQRLHRICRGCAGFPCSCLYIVGSLLSVS